MPFGKWGATALPWHELPRIPPRAKFFGLGSRMPPEKCLNVLSGVANYSTTCRIVHGGQLTNLRNIELLTPNARVGPLFLGVDLGGEFGQRLLWCLALDVGVHRGLNVLAIQLG